MWVFQLLNRLPCASKTPRLKGVRRLTITAACSFALLTPPAFAAHTTPSATIRIAHLRCDARINPLGVQTPKPAFSWVPVAASPDLRGLNQQAYQILVASSQRQLAQNHGNMWNSGRLQSISSLHHVYLGTPLQPHTTYWWKARLWDGKDIATPWSTPQSFTMGLLHPTDWKAQWITASQQVMWGNPLQSASALPVFRKDFIVHGTVKSALLFISGLGQYDAHIDGQPVTRSVLNPGWTDYRKTVLYNTFDLTRQIRQGKNVLAVLLGNGMYNVPKTKGHYQKFRGTFGPPKLIAQLMVAFADGRTETIATNSTWKAAKSPIIFSQTYGGEDFDSRIHPKWDRLNLDDNSWARAIVTHGSGGALRAQRIPPITVAHIYHPISVTHPQAGITVYDLGQNFAGWPQITAIGQAGSRIKLIPGELLHKNGTVSQRSMGGGPIWFTFVLNGSGVEHWHPRFTYTGFRYVQVETIPAPGSQIHPRLLSLIGDSIHASARRVGTFYTSDILFDRIHHLIDMAIQANMQSVLTDCPHREKLGWLEQTHLMGVSLFYNYNLNTLYEKMANDISEAQHANGLVPEIAPEYVHFHGIFLDSPEWGSAAILSPWTDYRFTGNLGILAHQYSTMKAYLAYLGHEAKDHILSEGLGDWYDLGPKPPGLAQLTGMKVTATNTYYRDLTVMVKIAKLLNKPQDAADYAKLAAEVKASYNREVFHPKTNQYDRGSQTANGMSLAVGIVPKARRKAVLDNLVADIRVHNHHLTSGEIGFHYVLEALRKGGRGNVICDMLSLKTPPSYAYQLQKGATTLTEAWNANRANSQDHFMLGDAEQWFYRGLAGLQFNLAKPKGKQIVFHPEFVCGIASASASYHSVLGRVAIAWRHSASTTQISVTVPVGQTALVYIPGTDLRRITESGKPALEARGVAWMRSACKDQVYKVESGEYHFTSRH